MADLPQPPQTTTASFTLDSDDISSLLNTLLHNSTTHDTPRQFLGSQPTTFIDSPSGLNFPFANFCGDVDCDSEDQEEAPVNPVPARGSTSKRTRAAEDHNLSEKRRRQRINEKMKALQKLIPNSNKTDKASMLDEAIEYLKQLQLQVQMLTMRNGSSLHPFYLPGLGQPAQVPPLHDEANSSRAGSFPANQEASLQAMFDLSSKPVASDYKHLVTRMSENSNSGPSFVLEPSTNAHYRSFNESMPSKVLCKDPAFPQLQSDMSRCGQSSSSGVSS